MTAIRLGLRYERLLILSAPLTLAALLVLFVAVASATERGTRIARCLETAAEILTKDKARLDTEWDKARLIDQKEKYRLELTQALIDGGLWKIPGITCMEIVRERIVSPTTPEPEVVISALEREGALSGGPINFYNVEIPEKVTVDLLGTDIKIGLITLAQIIQIALAPLLLLWLGSLYATRVRESHMVGSSSSLLDVFPHSINIYATIYPRQLRKRQFVFIASHKRTVVAFMTALFRVLVLSVFILPPAIFYIFSILYLNLAASEEYFQIVFLLGILVAFACLLNLLLEFAEWHYWKTFTSS